MLAKTILSVSALVTLASATCDLPPRVWCDSKEIARKWGVEVECAEQMCVEEADVRPIMLDLYFESLCPASQQFITEMLYPTWEIFQPTGIFQIALFSYGNAHETKLPNGMWNYTCQHGPDECKGNLIENCIQKYTNYDVMKYFPIFFCIESAEDPIKAAPQCVVYGNLMWSDILSCATGPEGNALMHKTAVATDKLDPPYSYVPWVVVNGVHTEALQKEAQNNLPKLICDMYKGVKPSQSKDY